MFAKNTSEEARLKKMSKADIAQEQKAYEDNLAAEADDVFGETTEDTARASSKSNSIGWDGYTRANKSNVTGKELNNMSTDELVVKLRGTGAIDDSVLDGMKSAMDRMKKAGYTFDSKSVGVGSTPPRELGLSRQGLNGVASRDIVSNPKAATIWVKDESLIPEDLVTTIAAHELLHTVSGASLRYGKKFPASEQGKAVAELEELFKQWKGKSWDKVEGNSLHDIDEFMSWGMTNTNLRNQMMNTTYHTADSIPVTMWEKFLNIIGQFNGHRKGTKTSYYDELIVRGNRVIDGVKYDGKQFKKSEMTESSATEFDTTRDLNDFPLTSREKKHIDAWNKQEGNSIQ